MSDISKKLDLVLLIDDDEIVNTLHTIILRQSGLVDSIQAVKSGEKGIEALKRYTLEKKWPAIIFVDINMPGITGWEFIDIFREQFLAFKQKCLICMLTSSLDPRDKGRADSSDLVDFYFSKPLTAQAVVSLVEKY